MKVFISWSGELSHKVALCLRDWLPNVVQTLNPYVSSEDIDKGTRWSQDIAEELANSVYGILCVTASNIEAPWLNFEAGALSKSIETSNVSPLLINVKKADLKGPILQFQATIFDKEDIKKLMCGLNRADKESRLDEQRLLNIFEKWWPELFKDMRALIEADAAFEAMKPPPKKEDAKTRNIEMLEEVLEISRQNTRSISNTEKILSILMEERRKGTYSIQDFSHPIFLDLAGSWSEFKQLIAGLVPEGQATPEYIEKMNEISNMIKYIATRNRYRPRGSRLLERLQSEE